MVTFGISPECLCHDVRDNVRRVADLEEAGFTHIWEGDHTLPWQHSSGHSAGIWATLTAFLAHTERAVVGPMVIPPIGVRHQPVDVAIEIATLELLYPGRVALGVGTGEAMNEKTTTGAWPSLHERIERLTEAIELIRRCWAEPDYFRHQGKHFDAFFYLYQKPSTDIPIICAAGGPKMAGNAGRLADGYVSVGVPTEVHRDILIPAFETGAAAAGRTAPSGFRSAWVSTSYHPDRERALEGARVYGGLLIPEAYAYIQDPRLIEQRALLVRDEALAAAFCIATSGEEIIARFEAFIGAGVSAHACDQGWVRAHVGPDHVVAAPESNGLVVRKEARKVIRPPGSPLSYELVSPDVRHKIEMIIVRLKPGVDGSAMAHEGEECALVLHGRVLITVGDVDYELNEGDSIYYDSGPPQKARAVGGEPAEIVSAITPPNF